MPKCLSILGVQIFENLVCDLAAALFWIARQQHVKGQFTLLNGSWMDFAAFVFIWVWINTYRYIFNGMNIHESQLFWGSLGTRVLTHSHFCVALNLTGGGSVASQIVDLVVLVPDWASASAFNRRRMAYVWRSYSMKHKYRNIRWCLKWRDMVQTCCEKQVHTKTLKEK